MNTTYEIIFRGKIQPGSTPAKVRAAFAQQFRISDPAGLDRLFSGQAIVLLRTEDADEARALQQTLQGLGALCDVQPPLATVQVMATRRRPWSATALVLAGLTAGGTIYLAHAPAHAASSPLQTAATPAPRTAPEPDATIADGAHCPATVRQNPRYAKIPSSEFLQCKTDPSDASRTLVAFASAQPDPDFPDSDQSTMFDLDVLLVRNDKGSIVAQYAGHHVYTSDGIRLWGIGLDTARYHLDKNTRAFGVTAESSGTGGARGVGWKQITLYARQGHQLVPVLKNLVVHSTGNGNFDCTDEEIGNGDGTVVTQRTISIAPTRSHGYADLIVDETVDETDSAMVKGKCVAIEQATTHNRYVLKYNGNEYPLPQILTE